MPGLHIFVVVLYETELSLWEPVFQHRTKGRGQGRGCCDRENVMGEFLHHPFLVHQKASLVGMEIAQLISRSVNFMLRLPEQVAVFLRFLI